MTEISSHPPTSYDVPYRQRTRNGLLTLRRLPAPLDNCFAPVKRVIVIPVIHNLADLGSLAESVRAHYLEHFGPAVWQQRQRAVEELWNDIRRAIDALHLDYRQVRIYQDGLPVAARKSKSSTSLPGPAASTISSSWN